VFRNYSRKQQATFLYDYDMIISVVAAKIWYLKNVRFLLGHPIYLLTNKSESIFSLQLHMFPNSLLAVVYSG